MHSKTLPAALLQDVLAHDRRPIRDRHLEGLVAARAAADFAHELAHADSPIPGIEVRFLDNDPE